METLTLDQWVEARGLETLRSQWIDHFEAYGDHTREEAEDLARLCLISLRDQQS